MRDDVRLIAKEHMGNASFLADIRAFSFDLFDTLIVLDKDLLPVLRLNGTAYRSTLPPLLDELAAEYPTLAKADILGALISTMVERPKASLDYQEQPDRLIFQTALGRLGIAEHERSAMIASRLCDIQMDVIGRAIRPRPGAVELLPRLRALGLRIALLSNLSHASSIGMLLERAGLHGLFDAVILSEQVGFCKPHKDIVRTTLEKLAVSSEHMLHLGDDARADIWGAGSVGIRTIWLNPAGLAYAATEYPPAWIIKDLREVLAYL